jgi:hypothetical protein
VPVHKTPVFYLEDRDLVVHVVPVLKNMTVHHGQEEDPWDEEEGHWQVQEHKMKLLHLEDIVMPPHVILLKNIMVHHGLQEVLYQLQDMGCQVLVLKMLGLHLGVGPVQLFLDDALKNITGRHGLLEELWQRLQGHMFLRELDRKTQHFLQEELTIILTHKNMMVHLGHYLRL